MKEWTALAVVMGLSASQAVHAAENDLSWSFTPYLWAANTQLDITWRESPAGGADIGFGDLLDTLEGAAMFQLEAGRRHWSSFLDLTYLSTSDSAGRNQINLSADSKQVFADVAAGYWPVSAGSGLNFFGGLRYTRFDNDYSLSLSGTTIADRDTSQDYTDALIGVRYVGDFNGRWGYLLRADTSFGDSDGTWLARAMVTYDIGRVGMGRVLIGYQLKSADFRDRELTTDYTYQGLVVGFQF
jgi:hypothetical protein